MKRYSLLLTLFFAVFTVVFVASNARQLQAQSLPVVQDVPHTISYQGLLQDTTGNPAKDGMYTIIMRLYGDAQGVQKVWQDTFTVNVQQGIFNVMLGGGASPLPDAGTMNAPLWLSMQVAGEVE